MICTSQAALPPQSFQNYNVKILQVTEENREKMLTIAPFLKPIPNPGKRGFLLPLQRAAMRKSGQQLERIGRKIQFMIDKICKLKYNMDAGKKGARIHSGKGDT